MGFNSGFKGLNLSVILLRSICNGRQQRACLHT